MTLQQYIKLCLILYYPNTPLHGLAGLIYKLSGPDINFCFIFNFSVYMHRRVAQKSSNFFFWPKILFWPIFFGRWKKFPTQNFFRPKLFFDQNLPQCMYPMHRVQWIEYNAYRLLEKISQLGKILQFLIFFRVIGIWLQLLPSLRIVKIQ